MNKRIAAMTAAALFTLTAGTACTSTIRGNATAVITTRTVTVDFTLIDVDMTGDDCATTGGEDGYSDIGPGSPVTITDENDKIIASAQLGTSVEHSSGMCAWRTVVKGVPDDRDQYAAQVANRGKITESHAQLAGDNWKFGLSLGSVPTN